MGSTELPGRCVGTSKNDWHRGLPAEHVSHLGGVVYNLVGSEHGKVERHELYNGPETVHGGPNAKTGKAELGNGGIDHSLGTIFIEQAFRYFVGTVILGNLLAHYKNIVILRHLFIDGSSQCFSEL